MLQTTFSSNDYAQNIKSFPEMLHDWQLKTGEICFRQLSVQIIMHKTLNGFLWSIHVFKKNTIDSYLSYKYIDLIWTQCRTFCLIVLWTLYKYIFTLNDNDDAFHFVVILAIL